jgi:hypothetical protein
MKIELITVNKQVAEDFLKNNDANRKLKEKVVKRYANDMRKGIWKQNTAELIKISKTGKLLDGQHRLSAIIMADIEIPMYIAFDLEDDVFDVLDTGSTRTAGDTFRVAGLGYSSSLPSIIQFSEVLFKFGRSTKSSPRLTNQELLTKYKEKEDYYLDVACKSHTFYGQFAKILPPTTIGGFIIFFNSKSSADCELFFQELCTGQNVTNKTIFVLRNKLIENKTSVKKMGNEYINALIIKAWNLYRLRQEAKVLRYNKELERSFPIAI